MASDKNEKREIIVAVIVCALVLVIVIGMVIMKKANKPKEEAVENKQQEVVISYDGYELSEEEIEQEAERLFNDDYTSTEVFLGMMGYRKTGKELLYTNENGKIDYSLLIYMSEEDRDAKFKESSEKITVDGKEYSLYETGISYDAYKTELLKYMSETVFENYFKPFTKNVDGKLYITNENEESYTLESLENIEEGKYLFTYQKDGESKDGEVIIDKTERTITEIKM